MTTPEPLHVTDTADSRDLLIFQDEAARFAACAPPPTTRALETVRHLLAELDARCQAHRQAGGELA